MNEEIDKQAEARRVLEAIRNKNDEDTSEKLAVQSPKRWLISEDAAQLQALVDEKRRIKNEPEPEKPEELVLDPESIETISSEQIKVMRKSAVNHKYQETQATRLISAGLIRLYFDFVDFFKPSGRAKRCLSEGHQCVHCGERFELNTSATNGSETVAQQSTSHPKLNPRPR